MSIQREVILRHRDIGHVRFQLPPQLCTEIIAQQLEQKLTSLPGINGAVLYIKQRKLSIRFDESTCSFNQLAKHLSALLSNIASQKNSPQRPKNLIARSNWRERLANKFKRSKTNQWLGTKYHDAKETVQAAKILTKIGMKQHRTLLQDPKQTAFNFLNEILLLYLIKKHWPHLTRLWLRQPLKYRYEWLTVFYLLFLFVRATKRKT